MRKSRIVSLPRFRLILPVALCLLAGPALAQQSGEVADPSSIGDFRLDQPAAGPTDPDRPVSTAPRAVPSEPEQPTEVTPQPTRGTTPTQRTTPRPAAVRPQAVPAAQPAVVSPPVPAPSIAAPSVPTPEVAAPTTTAPTEAIVDEAAPLELTPADGDNSPSLDSPPVTAPTANAAKGMDYLPYALGALVALILGFAFFRRKGAQKSPAYAAPLVAAEPATAPVQTPTPPATKAPAGTIGIPIAKLQGQLTPPPPPSARQGFVNARTPIVPAPRKAPAGTVGIPASRIAPPASPPPPAPELAEGTKLSAQFAAPELVRDADGLRLRFAVGIGNRGMEPARDVELRTVLLTAAPDSDRMIAGWLANPTGDAATVLPLINGGEQVNITGDIQLSPDQIRALTMHGKPIFVPMMALCIDYTGAEGLERLGEAYVIGQAPERAATNGKARVLPLPHDGELPRRWTDLLHRRADITP